MRAEEVLYRKIEACDGAARGFRRDLWWGGSYLGDCFKDGGAGEADGVVGGCYIPVAVVL